MNYRGTINTIVVKRDRPDHYVAISPLSNRMGSGATKESARQDFINQLNAELANKVEKKDPAPAGRPQRLGKETLHATVTTRTGKIIKTEARQRGISIGDMVDYLVEYHLAAETQVHEPAKSETMATVPSKRGRPPKPQMTLEDYKDDDGYFVILYGNSKAQANHLWTQMTALFEKELRWILKDTSGDFDFAGMAFHLPHWIRENPRSAKTMADLMEKAFQ